MVGPCGVSVIGCGSLPFNSKGSASWFLTRSFMMMCLKNWLAATFVVALMASTAAATDTVTNGKIKSINADNKTFVLTDSKDKDHTFKIGDNLVVNRGGKETKSDLKVGDAISVCYDPGFVTWTSHYILIHEGTTKESTLSLGN